MIDEKAKAHAVLPVSLKRYELGLAMGWTLVIILLLTVNVFHERKQSLETARAQARSNYQRDVIYRRWAAEHGGVYVRIAPGTRPNPYIEIPDRDITTTKGDRLTLVNPAYMTRLVFDLSAKTYDVKGHITSMRPVRPENRPDSWEKTAFAAFARGDKEVSSIEEMTGESYLRLMRPLVADKDCLICHGKDGYREGDIRGGISVAVPMKPLLEISRQNMVLFGGSLVILWLAGLGGIFTGAAYLQRAIFQRNEAQERIVTLNEDLLAQKKELEIANTDLEAFNYSVSHDLRKPLTVINSYCQIVEEFFGEKLEADCRKYVQEIFASTLRMNELIDTLLNFSRTLKVELRLEDVDLSGMAKSIAMELHMAEPERQVTFQITDDISARCDAALLRIVLDNLIGNSWKYSAQQNDAHIRFGAAVVEGIPCYHVSDNGPGFDMADAEKLFAPFQRIPGTGVEGHGIGLATVKRIIQRHGGTIWAEGEPGKGSTFYFTLCSASPA